LTGGVLIRIIFSIFGIPIHIWLGMILFVLIVFQVATGTGIIKVPFIWHKRMGLVIFLIVILHAMIGLGLWFGIFRIII
jgi:hypothetical protein